MSESKWLDDVAEELRDRGLSAAYIRRFMDELADHCEDLFLETASMDAKLLSARLGEPAEIANCAQHKLSRPTFAGRHPLVTFVAAPLPVSVLLIAGLCLAIVVALQFIPEDPRPFHELGWAATVIQALVLTVQYVPFVVGAVMFCVLAKRACRGLVWSFTACALVAVMAGLFAVQLTLPTDAVDSGALSMGFGFPPNAFQLLQALPPLAIWVAFAWRQLANSSQRCSI